MLFAFFSFPDIQLEDAGDYECIAENDVGKASGISTIHVIEPPIISIEPSLEVLKVTEGDELKVICTSSGTPTPTVQWVDENERVIKSPLKARTLVFNEAVLEIYRVSRTDSKAYKCVATNEAGTDEKYITVDVMPRRGDAPGELIENCFNKIYHYHY